MPDRTPSGTPDLIGLFATPVWATEIGGDASDLNQALSDQLLADERVHAGSLHSNVGGWHSSGNLAARPEACFRVVLDAVIAGVTALVANHAKSARRPSPHGSSFLLDAWAMIMRNGDSTGLHDHGDSHWSSVYWVDAGDAELDDGQSGRLVFVDPRNRGRLVPKVEPTISEVSFTPHSGALVVFPGWLPHYVRAYSGSRPRISISCNVVMNGSIRT